MADWQWQLELTAEDKQKSDRLAVALGAGTLICVVVAAVTSERYWFVMAFMLGSMLALGRSSTRRLRSAQAVLDGPMLTIRDSRATTAIDLRETDRLEVRQRSAQTRNQKWAVEATGPGNVTVHEFAGLEMYLNLSEHAIAPLRHGISHYHRWYRTTATTSPAAMQRAADADAVTEVQPFEPVNPIRRQDDFEWRPPRTEHADRNQRRVLVATVLAATALGAIGVQQSWGDTTGMILAVVVLPPLVLLLGLGCWYAFTPARRFRLSVNAGVLEAWRGSKRTNAIATLWITDIVVDVAHSRNHATDTNHSQPYVLVHGHDGSERIALPVSLGMRLNHEERVELEHRLKHHLALR